MSLPECIADRTAAVCVVGLGYVGLPLALSINRAGFKVTGLDSDPGTVEDLKNGITHILEVPAAEVYDALEYNSLTISSDPSVLAEADVVILCVPTPLRHGSPDMSFIEQAAQAVAGCLRQDQLVILESTTYPGTTEDFLRDILETSGLKAGSDFYLGFSPERIDPGNQTFSLANVPKVVGGFDPESTRMMEAFYGTFVSKVVPVSSAKTAEMAKLLENTYRHVNIALVNEVAILCNDLGIDVWEVIDAAATKPFGFEVFYPGPGWGGHCIPVDPAYLSWRVRQMGATARFVELAREFNQKMPSYVVQRIAEALNDCDRSLKGSSVLILGVAYKPEVSDCRESPAIDIIDRLLKSGCDVKFHDPYVPSIEVKSRRMLSCELTPALLERSDITVLHTSHHFYEAEWITSHAPLIFDTRNFFKGRTGRIFTL